MHIHELLILLGTFLCEKKEILAIKNLREEFIPQKFYHIHAYESF